MAGISHHLGMVRQIEPHWLPGFSHSPARYVAERGAAADRGGLGTHQCITVSDPG